jgi:TRAP transporter TAXI family solute receptor
MGAVLRALGWMLVLGGMTIAGALLPVPEAAAQQERQQPIRFFRIGTGASGGTFFPIGGLLASAISSPPGARPCDKGGSCGVPGLIAVAQSTEGSVENIGLILKGQLESGLCQADIAYAAYKGLGRFAREPGGDKLRAIASLYREAVQIVVRADSGIQSVADLKGKRVSLGEAGSGSLLDADAILAAYRLRERDLQAKFLKPGEASDALREKRIDAFFLVASVPVLTLTELAEAVPIRLLPVSAAALARLGQSHSFFGHIAVPAGSYKGVPAAETVSITAEWITTAEMEDELVYGITKALWAKSTRKLLESGHPEGAQIQLDTALEGIAIPLHPGAERFYREAGLIK